MKLKNITTFIFLDITGKQGEYGGASYKVGHEEKISLGLKVYLGDFLDYHGNNWRPPLVSPLQYGIKYEKYKIIEGSFKFKIGVVPMEATATHKEHSDGTEENSAKLAVKKDIGSGHGELYLETSGDNIKGGIDLGYEYSKVVKNGVTTTQSVGTESSLNVDFKPSGKPLTAPEYSMDNLKTPLDKSNSPSSITPISVPASALDLKQYMPVIAPKDNTNTSSQQTTWY